MVVSKKNQSLVHKHARFQWMRNAESLSCNYCVAYLCELSIFKSHFRKKPQQTYRMLRLAYLFVLCASLVFETRGQAAQNVTDTHGAIIRGDISQKRIAVVFTGDEFGDGGPSILKTLSNNQVHGSFFLTGNFYRNESFRTLIRNLRQAGHYLGAHSDAHLLYADWTRRDSLLVTEHDFKSDLRSNYNR